jgi:hypothetical protein
MSAPPAPAQTGEPAGRSRPDAGYPELPLLLRAAHPRQALITALALAVAAAVSGRRPIEVALVFVTVLVGQAVLGWDNDLVDDAHDRDSLVEGKPVAAGMLDRGSVWFTLVGGLLLVVPLALSSGAWAGLSYLLSIAVGLLGNRFLRGSVFSWLPWAVAFALYPSYLSYGGWGGGGHGNPPTIAMTVLAALLGIGVHLLLSTGGLVSDNRTSRRSLPLRVGLRLGASRLLVLAGAYCAVIVLLMGVVGATTGLSQP